MLYVPDSMNYFEPYFWPLEEDLGLVALTYDIAKQYQPGLQVSVRMGDTAPYFSSCQALLQTGVDALSYVYGSWGEGARDPQVNLLLAHNREHYAGFSYVENRPAEEDPMQHYETGSVDFMMLGAAVNGARGEWLQCLSPSGIALLAGDWEPPEGVVGFHLDIGRSMTLCFGPEASRTSGTLLTALEESGSHPVGVLYRHIGEHLSMNRTISGGLFSDTHRR